MPGRKSPSEPAAAPADVQQERMRERQGQEARLQRQMAGIKHTVVVLSAKGRADKSTAPQSHEGAEDIPWHGGPSARN